MSTPAVGPSRVRAELATRRSTPLGRQRPQSGYTLMEVLVAVAIISIVAGPLLAWSVLAIGQQPVTRDGLIRTASTGLLGSYAPRDIAVAGSASLSGDDCGAGDGSGGAVALVLLPGGSATTKIVYSESTPSDGDIQGRSVWRRECASDTGMLISATEVFEGVEPGSTAAQCWSSTGDDPCRQVELSTTPVDATDAVTVRATRRVRTPSTAQNPNLNQRPTARIRVTGQSGSVPLVADFTAADSTDEDGSIAWYRWELPTDGGPTIVEGPAAIAQTWTFPDAAGEYSVILTVTDDDGATHTTYRRFSANNQPPTAVASAAPTVGQAGVDEFAFSAAGSADPDGSIERYEWTLALPPTQADPGGSEVHLDGPSPSYTFAADILGSVDVTLTVSDYQGAVGSAFLNVTVLGEPVDPTDPTDPGDPPPPGAPTAVIVVNSGATAAQKNFDATGSTDDGQIVAYDWDFGVLTGTATGPTASWTYAAAGQYSVTLTVTDDAGLTGVATAIVTVPGAPQQPKTPWRVGSDLLWYPVPGARRYLVDFEYSTNTDCLRLISNQAVGAGPAPRKRIPTNPCPPNAQIRARVGADANGAVTWSPWTVITQETAPPEVVK